MSHLKNSIGKLLVLEILCVLFVILLILRLCRINIAWFMDLWSLLFILLPTVPILFLSGMAKDFAFAFTIGKKNTSLLQMKKSLEAVAMVQKLILCGIGFCVTVEFISLLHRLSDPSFLGPNISVILIAIFYGLFFEFMLIPLSTFIQNYIIDAMNIEDEEE